MPVDGGVTFSVEEVLGIVQDLLVVVDDLRRTSDDSNALIVDQVVNRMVDRLFDA